jgi:hypothetical protein
MQNPRTSYSWFCHDPSCSPDAKVFVDTSSVDPQLLGDPDWTPFAAHTVAATPGVSANAATGGALYSSKFFQQVVEPSSCATSPASQDKWAWLFEAGQFTPATSSSLSSGGNEEGLVAPEYGALFYGATT